MNQSELFDTDNPTGFDIRGGNFDTQLLYNGQPVILNWCDCQGSIGQLITRSQSVELETLLQNYRSAVEGELDLNSPLAPQIGLLTKLLVRGKYAIRLEHANSGSTPYIWPQEFLTERHEEHIAQMFEFFTPPLGGIAGYYPDNECILFALQEMSNLNNDRVQHYRSQARRGVSLYVVTLRMKSGHCQFIIDGHHKYRACWEENRKPMMLEIERIDAPPVDLLFAKKAFTHNELLAPQYFSLKEKCRQG